MRKRGWLLSLKYSFLAALAALALFGFYPEPVSAAATCIVDDNCEYWQDCAWNYLWKNCVDLPCADQRFLVCSSNADCGAGTECAAAVDVMPVNHECVTSLGVKECLSCASGTGDCDSNGGCETNLLTNVNNCGSCGVSCSSDKICKSGICELKPLPPCTNADGDGYFANAEACGKSASLQDCDDSNKFAYQYLNGYADSDNDGYGAGAVQKVCTGASLYVGYASVGGDCNDNDVSVHALNTCGKCSVEPSNLGSSCLITTSAGCAKAGTYSCDASVPGSGSVCVVNAGAVEVCNICGTSLQVCNPSGSSATTLANCPNGYPSVTVNCKSDCSGYEAPVCGSCSDGKVQSPEECEPGQTRAYTCPDGSPAPLPQTCELTGANACKWKPVTTCPVTSAVSSCSDGVKNGNELGVDCGGTCQTSVIEACNNADDNKNCQVDEGFNLNTDANNCGACGKKCGAGESCASGSCVKPAGPCGNGAIDPGEYCDGSNLNGQTCVSLGGYTGGTLSCVSPGQVGECLYDYTKCTLPAFNACAGVDLDSNKGCCLANDGQWLKSGELGQSASAASATGKTNQVCGGFSGFSTIPLPTNMVQVVQSLNSYGSSAYIMYDGRLKMTGYYTTLSSFWGLYFGLYQITGTVDPATGDSQVSQNFLGYGGWGVDPLPKAPSSATSDVGASFQTVCPNGWWNIYTCYYALTVSGYYYYVDNIQIPLISTTIVGVRRFVTTAGDFVVYSYVSGGWAYINVAKITSKVVGQKYQQSSVCDDEGCYYSGTGSIVDVLKPVAEITALYQGGVSGSGGYIQGFDTYLAANKIFIVPRIYAGAYGGNWHSFMWIDTMTGEVNSASLSKRSFAPGPLKLYVIGKNVYALWADSADNLMLASVDASKQLSVTSFSEGSQKVGALTTDINYATGGAAYSLAANDEALYVVYSTDNTILKPAPLPTAYLAYAKRICASAEKPDSLFRAAKRLPSAGTSFCLDNEPGFLRTKQCAAGVCASDPTDVAMCDKASDCVYKGVCYSDIKDVASTFFGGKQDSLMASSWKSEVSEAVMAGGGTGLCDPGQWTGPAGALSGSVRNITSGLQGASVSAVGTSNLSLTYSATTLNDGSYAISGIEPANYDVTASKTGYTSQTQNNVPIQPFQTSTVNFQLENAPVTAVVSGVVTNVSAMPVQGALVRILGTSFSATTVADGTYSIAGVPFGTYDVVASKPSDGYVDASALGSELSSSSVSVDLVLTRLSGGCNDDCTKADGLCHAECGGKGLCGFSSPDTAAACDLAVPGIITDPSDFNRQIMCCIGGSFKPSKADIKISCGDNVVSVRIPVLFRGRIVNMVVTTFKAEDCRP